MHQSKSKKDTNAKQPHTRFSIRLDLIVEPRHGNHGLTNPLFTELYSQSGKIRRRTKKLTLGVGEEAISVTTTQVACLCAVDTQVNHGYAIAKLYDLTRTTVSYSLSTMRAADLIKPTQIPGGGPERSIHKSHLVKCSYQLTEKGRSLIDKLRETDNAFFAECEAWLNVKKIEFKDFLLIK
ncbi:hypothetical protein KKE92_05030 [Candidatus Micrarchaeota archaeon]|nr:hypothetical protein [Candidatus Micrarchaeota archaeon]MBU1682058.1 hypothetical protein [Candidatus Micrarchaeota archaeon]